jgi:YVTN family beta-propeller protein
MLKTFSEEVSMYKNLTCTFVLFILLWSFSSFGYAEPDSVIATIWLPDSLGGAGLPCAFAYDSTDNKIFVCGGERVVVIDGATNQRLAGITVGKGAYALTFNSSNDKIYCANKNSDSVTIIDGAGNSVITTVGVGDQPYALTYNSTNNKVYCANSYSSSISVIACSPASAVEEDQETQVIPSFSLKQNYPNPFNPSTTLHFTVSSFQSPVSRPHPQTSSPKPQVPFPPP